MLTFLLALVNLLFLSMIQTAYYRMSCHHGTVQDLAKGAREVLGERRACTTSCRVVSVAQPLTNLNPRNQLTSERFSYRHCSTVN